VKRLIFVLLATTFVLCLCYFVSALGDRQTLIPPPESVAEQFLRAARTHRYGIALTYLSSETSNRLNEDDIQAFDQNLKNRLGNYEVSGCVSKIIGRSQAIANVQVKGPPGKAWPVFVLTLEHGLWKIEKILKPH
jgi:hypothetical protein